MYVPAPPAQPAFVLAPVGTVSAALSPTAPPLARALRTTVRVRSATLDVLSGHPAIVTGTLTGRFGVARDARRGGLEGRIVSLQMRGRRGWSTIARARTGFDGGFRLRYLARHEGSKLVRVGFGGDVNDLSARRKLGVLHVHRLTDTLRNSDSRPRRFEACVINAESGGNRYASNGVDVSYYQWSPSTYAVAARMAGEQAKYPTEASLDEQTKAFRAYEPTDPGAWPVTVPMCASR
jgi:hypothetical protein